MREFKSLTFGINHICFSITSIAIVFILKGFLSEQKEKEKNTEVFVIFFIYTFSGRL